jgi:hypothetical protein
MPCPALAVSEALGHCLTYRVALAEFGRDLGFAAAGEVFLTAARPRFRLLLEAAQQASYASEERHRREDEASHGADRAIGSGHDHALLCVAPVQVLTLLETVLHQLEELVGDLRAYPNVPGIRKRSGPGRPKEELLTLVWQTLRVGGFTYREIARFAPPSDGSADNVEELISRIEKRVKDEMPWVTDNRRDERFIGAIAPKEADGSMSNKSVPAPQAGSRPMVRARPRRGTSSR